MRYFRGFRALQGLQRIQARGKLPWFPDEYLGRAREVWQRTSAQRGREVDDLLVADKDELKEPLSALTHYRKRTGRTPYGSRTSLTSLEARLTRVEDALRRRPGCVIGCSLRVPEQSLCTRAQRQL